MARYRITITILEEKSQTFGDETRTYTLANVDVYTQTVDDLDIPAIVNFINRPKDAAPSATTV